MQKLNQTEERQFAAMAFRVKKCGESYRCAMYDRPKFIRTDSPLSYGVGQTELESRMDAFIRWSR